MATGYAIQTVLEIIAVVLIAYGILNEKKLIAFEQKIIKRIKKRIAIRKRLKHEVYSK